MQAQEEGEEYLDEVEYISRVQFLEVNFSMYVPLDAFSEKLEKDLLLGFSLGYLIQIQKEKPSFLGLEVFHKKLGGYGTSYDAIVGGEQLVLNGRVASNGLGINLNYRHYPPLKLGRFEPYFEGQFGVKWLYSYLSEAGAFSDDEPYDNFDFITGDWVLTYGGAAGFQIQVTDFYYINFKGSYHFAVSGKYERRLTGNLDGIMFPQEAFESVQSATNAVKIDLGMTFLF